MSAPHLMVRTPSCVDTGSLAIASSCSARDEAATAPRRSSGSLTRSASCQVISTTSSTSASAPTPTPDRPKWCAMAGGARRRRSVGRRRIMRGARVPRPVGRRPAGHDARTASRASRRGVRPARAGGRRCTIAGATAVARPSGRHRGSMVPWRPLRRRRWSGRMCWVAAHRLRLGRRRREDRGAATPCRHRA